MHVDYLVKTWFRMEIDEELPIEQLQKAVEDDFRTFCNNNGEINGIEYCYNTEQLCETEVYLQPSENSGVSTIEIWDGGTEPIWQNGQSLPIPEQSRQYSERFKNMSEGDYSGATEFEEYFVTAWAVADGGTKKALEAAMPEIFFE